MALPASGNSISLDQIHVELGESSGSTVALGDDDVRALASDTSGAIGMNQFFGLSSASNIEDVFSTFTYAGNGGTQNIVNGIDISGDGGLVWIKNRDTSDKHILVDTVRGVTKTLSSNTASPEATDTDTVTAFNNNGFSLGDDEKVNTNNEDFVSWTFKKQAGFFDIVTYSGTGSSRNISHNLGAVPGMMIIKKYEVGQGNDNWYVYHRGITDARTKYIELDKDTIQQTDSTVFTNTDPTDSQFTVGSSSKTNQANSDFICYLFAHQANDADAPLISCGSYTGDNKSLSGSGAYNSVNCGFEPQFIMIKCIDVNGQDWHVMDRMRGLGGYRTNANIAIAWNESDAEDANGYLTPTPTGFEIHDFGNDVNNNGSTYIYMAIRKGPMAAPTSGSEIISIDVNSANQTFFDSAHPVDMAFWNAPNGSAVKYLYSRKLYTAELIIGSTTVTATNTAVDFSFVNGWEKSAWGDTTHSYMFHERAKAFATQVYKGTGSNTTITHGLGVAPELLVVKNMSATQDWTVYYGDNTDHLHFNSKTGTADLNTIWNDTSPTSSVFSIGTHDEVNQNNAFYFAFMFATLAGVTKVGTVNVTGATNVDCGFSSGSKFVMIKRYDGNGHWLVFDTTTGLVAGNDTYRKLEHTSAAVTNADVIDPLNAGFSLTAAFLDIDENASGDYVFVAIAA